MSQPNFESTSWATSPDSQGQISIKYFWNQDSVFNLSEIHENEIEVSCVEILKGKNKHRSLQMISEFLIQYLRGAATLYTSFLCAPISLDGWADFMFAKNVFETDFPIFIQKYVIIESEKFLMHSERNGLRLFSRVIFMKGIRFNYLHEIWGTIRSSQVYTKLSLPWIGNS